MKNTARIRIVGYLIFSLKIVTFPLNFALIILLKIYKWSISPYLPNACRFTPTCSEYGIHALKKHGIFYGLFLTFKRLLKCHPWGGHGYDPVP